MGAALFLSKLGLDITLVEKSPRLGALARGFKRQGLTFETGFHYAGGLEEGGVLHRYLQRLGLFDQGLRTCPLPDPGGEFLRFPESGQDFSLPRNYDEFRRLLPKTSEIDDFYRRSLAVFRRSPFLNSQVDSFAPLDLYNSGESLAAALARLPISPQLKSVLGFRCLLYGARPSQAFFNHFSLVNVPYLNGSHTFEGGGPALVRAFEAALKAAGINVLTGRKVIKIETDRHNAAIAAQWESAGGEQGLISFDACVYTGSPAALPHLLPDGALRPVLIRRLAGYNYTPSPLLIFAKTRSKWLEHRQLYICPDELENWFDPAEKAVYASGGPGREGFWPISAVALLPEGATAPWRGSKGKAGQLYRTLKESLAAEAAEHLLKHCPELNGDLEIIDSATDLTLGRYSLAFGPGIYGKLHSVNEAPILSVTRVGRLALAGQNIIMPGLLGVLVSSALAASFLTKYEKVLEVLK